MGLGTKIKNALNPEHPPSGGYKHKLPGTFPDESSTRVDNNAQRTSQSTTTGGTTYLPRDEPSVLRRDKDGLGRKGTLTGRQSGPDVTNGFTNADTKEYHSGESDSGYDAADTALSHGMRGQSDHTRGARHAHRDSAVDIGLTDRKATLDSPTGSYKNWAAAEHGISAQNHYDPVEDDFVSTRSFRERDHLARNGKQTRHSPSQAVGGGVYNGVTGHGSSEDSLIGAHASHGIGVARSTGPTADTKYDARAGTRDIAPTSRSDRTGPALAGAGATIGGAGAAAALAHRHHQDEKRDRYGDRNTSGTGTGGVPHSSLLEPDSPTSTDFEASHSSGTRRFSGNTTGNKQQGVNMVPGMGEGHYGPGHQGAKVLHQCQHCGVDNDISHYFRREAVYRIG